MIAICEIFRNDKRQAKYLSDRKLKMLSIFIMETKGAKNDKNLNFLKGCFSVMGGPMDKIFCVFSKTYVRLVKSIILKFF